MRALAWASLLSSGIVASTTALGAFPDCPTGAPVAAEGLTTWRAEAVAAMGSGNASGVSAAIKQCFPAKVPVCLQRVSDLTTTTLGSPSQDASFQDTPQRQPPPELFAPGAGPTDFKYFVRTDIEALAKEKGWNIVRYKSRHAGGFDSSTSSLMMLHVPGDKVTPPVGYDRWLNFALPADVQAEEMNPTPQQKIPDEATFAAEGTGPSIPRTFTMVSLDKAADGKPGQVYFQMFKRTGFGSGIYTPSGTAGVSSCYSCHPNGLRSISPMGYHVRAGEPQLPPDAWAAVKTINDAMDEGADLKMVSWRDVGGNPLMRPKAYWPIYGANKPLNGMTRTREFIMGGTLANGTTVEGCYKSRPTVKVTDIFGRPPGRNNIYKLNDTPDIAWEKVRDAMKCETCHNNKGRGAINKGTSYEQVDFKILVDQSMPLGFHENPLDQGQDPAAAVKDSLTGDERIALANCLKDEFAMEAPFQKEWLTAQACQ